MSLVESFNYSTRSSTYIENFYTKSTADSVGDETPITTIIDTKPESAQLMNSGKYSIYSIADWFLMKSNMTHLKLQKLCYYAQAWSYALLGYGLANTTFQAWVHGPVSPALYERFKGFGYETITISAQRTPTFEPKDEELLNRVWETYGDLTGNALEALAHRETPWIEARHGYADDERCNVVISPETMKNYYRAVYSGQ